jgi:hypothetical protein
MSRTHVFLRCMHPQLESARKEIWERPDEDGRKGRRPKSIGQLLGKAKLEKPLADWIGLPVWDYLGQRNGIWRWGESRGMIYGGVSHPSEYLTD